MPNPLTLVPYKTYIWSIVKQQDKEEDEVQGLGYGVV